MRLPRESNNTVATVKSSDEIKENLSRGKTDIDPDFILEKADKELSSKKAGQQLALSPESNVFKAMTLLEFDNGMLMTTVIPEQYKIFGIDMMRQLQKEFLCETISEKATAELAALSYIRTLETQNRINRYLALGSVTDVGVRFLAVMSKELDRANRHYLTAIQTLKMFRQLPIKVNVQANTAIVGQNQFIQENQNVKPI